MLPLGARPAIIGIGVDADTTTRHEETRNLDILGVHQPDEVFHDDVHAVFVEIAMVAEREEIQLQTLALYHALVGNIRDAHLTEVGLPGDRAQTGKLRTVETHPIVVLGMLVLKGFKHFGCILVGVVGVTTEELQPLVFS